MISENQIEQLVERLVDRIEQANLVFLEEIGKSIKKIGSLTPTKAQQLINILKYGGNYEDIIYKISQITDLNIKDIDEIFHSFAEKDRQFYKQFYEYRNVPFTPYQQNGVLVTQVQALANITKNELSNFMNTRALGYSIKDVNGRTVFMGLNETYNRVLDEAILNVGQGKETFDTAMRNTLKQLGSSGLKTIDYQGRSMRLDSAVRMHMQGALRNLHNETQKIYGQEFGADGVEISVHGNPAPDHAEIQGCQFNYEEYEKLQAGFEAKTYQGKTVQIGKSKKGSYRPISEYNCYHYEFDIVVGVSQPQYSDKQLQDIINENNKPINIDGKEYTKYECTQLQRKFETAIRKQKDIQILAKASGNDNLILESQQNITQLTNKYREISKKAGLPTKADRLRVSGYRRTKVKQNNVNKPIIYTKNEQYAIQRYLGGYSYTFNAKLRDNLELNEVDKTTKINLDSALNKTPNYNGKIVRTMNMADPETFINQLEVGKEYSTGQYLSFSTKGDYDDTANVKIYVKDSTKSKDLTKINQIGENETLYKRNEKFITEKIIKRKGKYYVYWKEKQL